MLRILNVLAVAGLIGSAVYAYSVKYQTILFSEQIVKAQTDIRHEQDQINMLRAEWAYLVRPERIQILADQHLDLQPVNIDQIVKVTDLPNRMPKVDDIGRELDFSASASINEYAARRQKCARWCRHAFQRRVRTDE